MTDLKVSTEKGLAKEDVVEFYDEFFKIFEETTSLRIGGYQFEDSERISVDLTVALTDFEEAEDLGRELNQESIFNPSIALGQDNWDDGLVTTGGSGESPLNTPGDLLEKSLI